MVKFKVYKLHFKSALHISDLRDDASTSQRVIHSDTFQAALLTCLAKIGEEIPTNGDIGCVISDLFPYYQKNEEDEATYFLPMPMRTTFPQLSDPADAKKVKKVQWVDFSIFQDLLNGAKIFDQKSDDMKLVKSIYMTRRELPKDVMGSKDFVKSQVVQRVSIKDRTGQSDAVPYYVDRISFQDASGLYFLCYGDTSLLDKAISLLETEGIGTDRHVGYGLFDTISVDNGGRPLEIEFSIPEDASFQISLSMFIPESEKQLKLLLDSDKIAYDFSRRGGWITTPQFSTYRKNAIYAFLPGSVFCKTDGNICTGKIVDLTPQIEGLSIGHKIWRNGRAIVLPIKI